MIQVELCVSTHIISHNSKPLLCKENSILASLDGKTIYLVNRPYILDLAFIKLVGHLFITLTHMLHDVFVSLPVCKSLHTKKDMNVCIHCF